MKRSLLVTTVLLLLTYPTLSQGLGERSGVNILIGKAPSTEDFVKTAAMSDMFEIESSKVAQQKADESSKKFGLQMIADHTKTTMELKALASKAGVELPTALDSSHQSKIDKLSGLMGVDFDREYDAMQVEAHEDAVSLFERYAEGGDNAELKAWAGQTLPNLTHHLEMAKR
jgi:putative membrane protein